MFFHRRIFILLCWTCVRGIEQKIPEYIIDQVATASENFSPFSSTAYKKNSTIYTNSSLNIGDNSSMIHYENGNGFVPMSNYYSSKSVQAQTDSPLLNYHSRQNVTSANLIHKWENDPALSTEARFLLTLAHSGSNRRSFDLNENQKEFEILKVTNKTPAIANYHEFYENLRSNLRTEGSQSWPDELSNNNASPIVSTKERIRQINEYFDYNSNGHNSNANYHHHLKNYPTIGHINSQKDTIQQSSMFEPTKVPNNYHQYGNMNYGIFDNEKKLNVQRNNFPSLDNEKSVMNKHHYHNSKPVIIVESNDYSTFNSHQLMNKASTTNPYIQTTISEDRYDRKEDYSDDSSDYLEITERPKRLQKHRRRPYNSDNGKKMPKEQKNDGKVDELKKINSSGMRIKSQRSRGKPIYWNDERHNSYEDNSEEKHSATPDDNPEIKENHHNKQNGWSQVTPNVEYSPSNSYEINPTDNSKVLVPVNLNLVPLNHFDHNSVPGNSQGFGLSNIITAGSIVTSTASPLINTTPSLLSSHLISQTHGKNNGYSNAVSDIIVGQNSYQNPVQAVLLPQMNVQTKYPSSNVKPQYVASTMAPMFSFTQSITPTMQSVQSTQSPRITTTRHQYGPQIFFPQSTLQTLLQTPLNSPGNYNIFVKPTALSINNSNHGIANSERKNNFRGTDGQILTSASYSISQDAGSNYPTINNNNNENNQQQLLKSQIQGNLYPIIRETQVVPAYIQATPSGIPGLNVINQNHGHTHQSQIPRNPNHQEMINIGSNIFENTWRHHLDNNEIHKNGRYQNTDSLGSTTNTNNNVNTLNNVKNLYGVMKEAQLPVVGMQTVEIRNPNINIKPSPIDLTMVNPLETINHYPTAVLTTPIPILSTTGYLAARPLVASATTPESVSIQSYIDSLTQIGSQNNQGIVLETKTSPENPQPGQLTYNPMNFIPNWDLIRSQTILNNKVHVPKPLPKHLNLIPIIPGGNFDKHSPIAQIDLITKPKLSSDLEKYAEEMFKESLRTIYNSHKWNTDKKMRNLTENDIAELEKLKRDLAKFKAEIIKSNRGKDILEAHQSETKFRTAEPGGEYESNGLSIAAIEHLLKSDFKTNKQLENSHSSSHIDAPNRANSGQSIKINDYLTPPRKPNNSHGSKSPFSDKPGQKRPATKAHRHPRPINRPVSLDTSASNHIIHSRRRPYHERSTSYNDHHNKNFKSDNYPTLTTSLPTTETFNKDDRDKLDNFHLNHPRTHNLLGLLMKNKQLPNGSNSNIFSDEDQLNQYLEEEKRRQAEKQFYDGLQSLKKKSDLLAGSMQLPVISRINPFH